MGKAARITLVLISIVVFIGIPLLIALRIWDAADSGSTAAEHHFARMVDLTREYSEKLDKDNAEAFASAVGPEARGDERLITFVVAEAPDRIDYAWSRFRYRLPQDLHAIEADLRLETAPPWERSFDRTFVTPAGNRMTVSSVYTVLDREVVFQFLRDGLLAALAFALLVLVALIASLKPAASNGSAEASKVDAGPGGGESASSSDRHRKSPDSPGSEPVVAVDGRGEAGGVQAEPSAHEKGGPPLVSPESGLSYEAHLTRRLDRELERAAENDLNLSLLMLYIADSRGSPVGANMLGTLVLEHFPFEDLVFEYNEGTACAVLPGYELDAALRKAERMWRLLRRHDLGSFHARIGASSRNGRLVESERMIDEAVTALAKTDKTANIVGFQPDPDRYRRYIASKLES